MACGGCGGNMAKEYGPHLIGESGSAPSVPTDGGSAVAVRKLCPRCTFKHLAYAYVALGEAARGYPEHIHLARVSLVQAGFPPEVLTGDLRLQLSVKARAVGHLVHAMEECLDRDLAKKIRAAYTAILDNDAEADILSLLAELEKPKEEI